MGYRIKIWTSYEFTILHSPWSRDGRVSCSPGEQHSPWPGAQITFGRGAWWPPPPPFLWAWFNPNMRLYFFLHDIFHNVAKNSWELVFTNFFEEDCKRKINDLRDQSVKPLAGLELTSWKSRKNSCTPTHPRKFLPDLCLVLCNIIKTLHLTVEWKDWSEHRRADGVTRGYRKILNFCMDSQVTEIGRFQ